MNDPYNESLPKWLRWVGVLGSKSSKTFHVPFPDWVTLEGAGRACIQAGVKIKELDSSLGAIMGLVPADLFSERHVSVKVTATSANESEVQIFCSMGKAISLGLNTRKIAEIERALLHLLLTQPKGGLPPEQSSISDPKRDAPTGEHYVFISYASVDRERVVPIVAALRNGGIRTWIDFSDIPGGANYGATIAAAIEDAEALVVMATISALQSRNVEQELALAWQFNRPCLPLLLESVTIPKNLSYWLATSQWIQVYDKEEQQWLPAVLRALGHLGPFLPSNSEKD